MDCVEARDLIFRADGPASGPLAAHLLACGTCARLAADLAQIEDAWRAIPLPVEAIRGREAFLARLSRLEPPIRRRPLRRWLVAASILIGLGLWGGILASGRRAVAASDVMERLVDWNLRLADVETPAERGRIYADHAPALASEVERAGLPAGDRELADALLENAPRMALQADPLADADRFDDLADRLLRRMDHAASGDDPRRLERYARLYHRVSTFGIGSKFDLLEESDVLDFGRKHRLERLILRDAVRMDALLALLEKAPDSSRREIKKALGISRNLMADGPIPRQSRIKDRKPRPAGTRAEPPNSRNRPPFVP